MGVEGLKPNSLVFFTRKCIEGIGENQLLDLGSDRFNYFSQCFKRCDKALGLTFDNTSYD